MITFSDDLKRNVSVLSQNDKRNASVIVERFRFQLR